MVRSVEQIERDIAALEQMLAGTADEFYSVDSGYLAALGQAVKQQLILASYHLCTQGYPQQFLRLSFNQRHQLQQSLKQLAKQAQETLLEQLRRVGETQPEQKSSDKPAEPEEFSPASLDVALTETVEKQWLADVAEPPTVEPQPKESEAPEPETLKPKSQDAEPQCLTPERLVRWREGVERAIARTLSQVSKEANHLFQQVDILPKELPEVLLEAASKAEEAADSVASTPNLLNLLVETVDENRPEAMPSGLSITHIVAIHLRLAEIEFTDSTVAVWRQKLRNLSGRLQSLGKEYQKKQRERAIAEAESAWRASWFED
ncbi:hypothetical protein NDA01_06945 [Trichocoleus desertorum AS-A10]|uniref:hypothetical protein n=1 Tax=Trichocoleus desertorum TaxID=1481672 RepID=UPI0032996831